MDKNYDKIALGVAVLLLIVGFALAMPIFTGALSLPESRIDPSDISGDPYSPIIEPDIVPVYDEWLEPIAQDEDGKWLFQIFTPPRIYLTPEGKLKPIPIVPPESQPFGVKLVAIVHPLYRVQFESYLGDEKNPILSLLNVHTGMAGRHKLGDKIDEWGISIKDFKVSVEIIESDEGETRHRIEALTIMDHKMGHEVVLKAGERRLREDLTDILMQEVGVIQDQEADFAVFHWEKKGDTYKRGLAEYTLKNFDFDNQVVTVRKEAKDIEDPETEELNAEGESFFKPETKNKEDDISNPSDELDELDDLLF